jgi:hypothetical protein
VTDDLLDLAIATTGGRALWNSLCGLRIDIRSAARSGR